MAKSIISNERECLVCKTTLNLHKHHFFGGRPNRRLSEKYGFWGYFCAKHHNMSKHGIHFDMDLRDKWQRIAQRRAMACFDWSAEDFGAIIGKSYLDGEG